MELTLAETLGVAEAAFRAGRLAEAEQACRAILAMDPKHFQALLLGGVVQAGLGRAVEALALYDRALATGREDAVLQSNRAKVLAGLGRFDEALAAYDRALALKPDLLEAHYNQGNVLFRLGRLEEAVAAYGRALATDPNFAKALNNRGSAFLNLKLYREALADFDRGLALEPKDPGLIRNRALALNGLGQFNEAITGLGSAVAAEGEAVAAKKAEGDAFLVKRQFALALEAFDAGLRLAPEDVLLHAKRGEALRALGRHREALAAFLKVLQLDPDHHYALSEAANAAALLSDWPAMHSIMAQIPATLRRGGYFDPWRLLTYSGDPALQLAAAKSFVAERVPRLPEPLSKGASYDHERIRLAYVSADFREHAVALQIVELLERHDRSRFEVHAVSFGPDEDSPLRRRIRAAVEHFHDVARQSDREIGELMHRLEIDIAVDLTAHTEHARPGILAQRPAPVAVSYLGFPATTGAPFIDYILADETVLPFDMQPFYCERIVHLPGSYMVSDSRRRVAAETPTRRACGLPERGFVFCAFNQTYKVFPPVFDIWMRLLEAVGGSVLWVRVHGLEAMERLKAEAAARGVDPARLVAAGPVETQAEHLARQRLADLFLDTLPYNAHSTASDALWAGLPMLTCLGESFAGRVAASMLRAIGLPELVTESLEDYEALALSLATSPERLAELRRKLLANRATQPLFDTDLQRRHIEAAFEQMVARQRRGEGPEAFVVEPIARSADAAPAPRSFFAPSRVYILDPQLNLVDGHYATYDSVIAKELHARGVPTEVYGNANVGSGVPPTMAVEPLFSAGIFDETYLDEETWPIDNFVALGEAFYADLATLPAEDFRATDLAFFPTLTQNHIDAIRRWVVSLPADRRPALVLKPSYLTHAMPYVQERRNKDVIPILFRSAMRRLVEAHPRTRLCTDTEAMAAEFSGISGLDVSVVPLPLAVPRLVQAPNPGKGPVVAYLGHASVLKGFDLLPEIIDTVHAKLGSGIEFIIQSFGDPVLCQWLETTLASAHSLSVSVIQGTVDSDAYLRLLSEADIILLPYAREFYGWASSGILTEAMSLAKVAVAPDGTWAADQLERFGGGGVLFREFNAPSVAAAVERAIREFPVLRQRALAAAESWRAAHSPASFVDALLALAS